MAKGLDESADSAAPDEISYILFFFLLIIFYISGNVILSKIIGNRTNVPWLIVALSLNSTFFVLFPVWIILSVLGTEMGYIFGRPPKKLSIEIKNARKSTE